MEWRLLVVLPRRRIGALLRALRDRIALELDNAGCTRDVEPLARRLQSLASEIDELSACRESSGTPADVIRERREARRREGVVSAPVHDHTFEGRLRKGG